MLLSNPMLFITIFSLCIGTSVGFFEIIAGFGSYLYKKTVCFRGNCCTKNEIPANFEVLEASLRENVFGQPLVQSTVVNALKIHWNQQYKSNKALTLSFHGGTGVGKNYVSMFIQEALYKNGMKSPHVHNFVARLDFPEVSKVDIYKKNLANWIRGNVTNCPKQLFIFDEVQNMPPGVLDVIKPFIDYIDYVNGVSYKEAIFIFLSNTGSKIINNFTYDLWKEGIGRDELRLSNFEKIIAQGAFNEKGGFLQCDIIKSNLVDHYIPFLPLMESHLILCVKKEFHKRGVNDPTKDQIMEVMEFIDWGPEENKIFSKTGCKRISQKVGLLSY